MGHLFRTRRVLTLVVVSIVLLSVGPAPGVAQTAQSSGRALERLRERARFMSSFNRLEDLGAGHAGGRQAASATAQPGVLRWLEMKHTLSRFATAGGPTGASSSKGNVRIGADPVKDENEPTMVANPHDRTSWSPAATPPMPRPSTVWPMSAMTRAQAGRHRS